MTSAKFYKLIDIPAGVIMSISTVSVLVFSYAAVFAGKTIPGEVVAIYGTILGAYALNRTLIKVQEIKANASV